MGRNLLLAAMLTFAGSGAAYVPPLGQLVKTFATVDGPVSVYRLGAGCALAFRGVVLQVVDAATCRA